MYRAIQKVNDSICLTWFFMSKSTIFQLCQDGSSWVEPGFNVSCSRTQPSAAGDARTRNSSVLSQALYHLATALPVFDIHTIIMLAQLISQLVQI